MHSGAPLRWLPEISRLSASSSPLRLSVPVSGSCRAWALVRSSAWRRRSISAFAVSARWRSSCSSWRMALLFCVMACVAAKTSCSTGLSSFRSRTWPMRSAHCVSWPW